VSLIYERPVRFEEIDAAGIVFFGRFMSWSHEAMEHFFGHLPGGYVDLIVRRRVGFPAVHLHADWKLPFKFGDTIRIETSIAKVGTTSVTFRYDFGRIRPGGTEAEPAARIEHVCVTTNLDTMEKVPLPEDCRALFAQHLSNG
jgi:4-hydroxybenzoyl-CoA thioesterase